MTPFFSYLIIMNVGLLIFFIIAFMATMHLQGKELDLIHQRMDTISKRVDLLVLTEGLSLLNSRVDHATK